MPAELSASAVRVSHVVWSLALCCVLWSLQVRAQDAPRQVEFGVGRVEEGVRVVPVEIDQVEGVLALDLDIVLGSEGVRVLDVRGTDLLDGFFVLHNVVEDTLKVAAASARAASAGSGAFVELVLEDVGTDPELRFLQVLLNDDGIPIEYEPRYEPSTAVVEGSALPNASHLRQNFPNPFNGETVLAFSLAEPTHAELIVYNTAGQRVCTLLRKSLAAGLHRVSWDATDGRGRKLASGRYIASLETGNDRQAIGMVFVE